MKLSVSRLWMNKENIAEPRENQKTGEKSTKYAHSKFDNVDWTTDQIIAHITSGFAICPAELERGWRTGENFISAQIVGLDFDKSPGMAKLKDDPFLRQYAFLIYPTPSHTPATPRHRALFALDAPITDAGRYTCLMRRLVAKFADYGIDAGCVDPVRKWNGSTVEGAEPSKLKNKRLPLAVLEGLPETDDEIRARQPREPRPVYQPSTDAETRQVEAYSRAAVEGIRNEALADGVAGTRHNVFISASLKLISIAKGSGWLSIDAEAEARSLGLDMGRDRDEIEDAIRGAYRKAEPRDLHLDNDRIPKATPDTRLPSTDTPQAEPRKLTADNLLTAIDQLRSAIRDKSRSDADIEHLVTQAQGLIDQVSMGLAKPTVVEFGSLMTRLEADAIAQREIGGASVIGLRLNASGEFENNSHTGFPQIEQIVGGLPEDLTVIIGATGSGKSWTCTSFARELLVQMNGLIITTEMTPLMWLKRLVASASGASYTGLKHGTSDAGEWARIQRSMQTYGLIGAAMLDHPSPTPRMVRAAVQRQLDTDGGIGWLIVDSASKMNYPGAGGIYDRMSGVMNGLQDIAREFSIPVIASLQTSGDIENRGKGQRLPRLNDAYGGMVAVQNAGLVIALYNHSYYVKRELEEANPDMPEGTIAVRLLKIRDEDDSEAPVVKLKWQGAGYREWRTQTVSLASRKDTHG